jgi:hypothetical protein
MTGLALMMMAGALLAGPPGGEIVCDTEYSPVQIDRSRVFTLERQTRCDHLPEPGVGQLEKLKLACDLLITAYGEEDGRLRCQDLIERSDLDP